MKKILIIETRPGIGDLCMYIPRIHEIKFNYPNFKIFLLTKKENKSQTIAKI